VAINTPCPLNPLSGIPQWINTAFLGYARLFQLLHGQEFKYKPSNSIKMVSSLIYTPANHFSMNQIGSKWLQVLIPKQLLVT